MANGPTRMLKNSDLAIFKRNGIYQARIHTGPNKYIYRTLKTGNEADAERLGEELFHEIRIKIKNNIQIQEKKFSAVVAQYVAFRESEHKAGRTKDGMLRQIRRVSKFWIKYAGHLHVASIDDVTLENYVDWRRAYYQTHTLPRNGKPNPADKTLQWDVMLGKAILKWATKKGYRKGCAEVTWSFVPKVKRVRPAFERHEYRALLMALRAQCSMTKGSKRHNTYLLLRDYVLILANSGIRVGEANNLRYSDLHQFIDDAGRKNYRLTVDGKTGKRDVIPRVAVFTYLNRVKDRNPNATPNDYVFSLGNGRRITTLSDQFKRALKLKNITTNSTGEPFTLYSLRHFYAVQAILKSIDIFTIARNMGTSVDVIQKYYAKQATPVLLATKLGGPSLTSSKTATKHPKKQAQGQPAPSTSPKALAQPSMPQSATPPAGMSFTGSTISTNAIPPLPKR